MPSGSGGDTYSFGVSGTNSASDRALGTLQSGSLNSTIGATFTNNTSSTISSLDIAYRGEMWRLGSTVGRTDELDFQYSLNATSLSSGTWTGVSGLNFVTPDLSGSVGARDGNASGKFTDASASITSLSISNGATFWIRWLDFDALGSDDGLAVDDFSLTPHSATGTSTWTGGGGNNNWSTASNWSSAPSGGSNLVFAGSTRPSNSNDTLASVGSITFDSTAGSFTLAGNAVTAIGGVANNSTNAQTISLNLTLGAAQQFNAASGNLAIDGAIVTGGNALTVTGSSNTALSGAISGSGALVKSGAGTLTVSGNNTYSGGTTVSSGALTVGHVNALGTSGLTINASAAVQLQSGLTAPVQFSSLTIQGGTTPTGTLDITDNNVIVRHANYASAAADLATLTAQIASGFNGFSWTGTGITSSTAVNNPTLNAVGIIPNTLDGGDSALYDHWPVGADDVGGPSVDQTDVLIKYTYTGDANLDGVVDADTDYALWNIGLSSDGGLSGWLWGDFDYSGTIDVDTDYTLWNLAFSAQTPGNGLGGGVQPVPEPSTLVLTMLGLAGLTRISPRRARALR